MLRKVIVIFGASLLVVMGVAGCASKATKPAVEPKDEAKSADKTSPEADKKHFDKIMEDWRKLNAEGASPEEEKKIPVVSPP